MSLFLSFLLVFDVIPLSDDVNVITLVIVYKNPNVLQLTEFNVIVCKVKVITKSNIKKTLKMHNIQRKSRKTSKYK